MLTPRACGRQKTVQCLLILVFVLAALFWRERRRHGCGLATEEAVGLVAVKEPKESSPARSAIDAACSVPELDPWDASIRHLLVHPPPLRCPRIQPDLFFIDRFGTLRLNHSEAAAANMTEASLLKCTYLTFDQEESEAEDSGESRTHASATVPWKGPVALPFDFCLVQCLYDQELVYSDALFWPSNKTKTKATPTNATQFSVLLLFIDSISTSAFQRHMPKTSRFLREEMGFHLLPGHSKVADNSFPNIIPILTGKRALDQQPDMQDEFDHVDLMTQMFDEWPLIWRQFANKSYVTSFSEDTPFMGLFHLGGNGFLRKPVDHYYHPYWSVRSWTEFPKDNDELCTGNVANAQVNLDIIRKQLDKYGPHTRQFMYIYFTELSHTHEYGVERADHLFLEFFKEMKTSGGLDSTVVMFLGDHGHRSSAIRTTLVGLMEERLPFLAVHLPPALRRSQPRLEEALALNAAQRRLSSHFDLHETLLDVLNGNYDGRQRPPGTRGLSLLYPIPKNRTCREAGIPLFYCTCQELRWTSVPPSALRTAAATHLVSEGLNAPLHNRFPGKCLNLTLAKILEAEKLEIGDQAADSFDQLRLTVEVFPLGGRFQALVHRSRLDGSFMVHSDVSRLNRYGNQSHCLRHKQLSKFCVCPDALPKR